MSLYKNPINRYTIIIPFSLVSVITYNIIKKYIRSKTQNIIIEKSMIMIYKRIFIII